MKLSAEKGLSREPAKGADPPLLPCPFCGRDAVCKPDEIGSGGQHVTPYHAGCYSCRVFFVEEEESDAIAGWNRRASPIKAEVTTGEAELTDKELMRILRDADGGEALSVRLRPLYDTVWKDGIDIEQPSYLYKTLARRIAKSENASLRAKLAERERQLKHAREWLTISADRWTDLGKVIEESGAYHNAAFCHASGEHCRDAARQSAQAASQPSNPET